MPKACSPRDSLGGASDIDVQHAWLHAPEYDDGDREERRHDMILSAQVGTRPWDRVLREKWITPLYMNGSEICPPRA